MPVGHLMALQAILNGNLSVDTAFADNLIVLNAGETHTRLLRSALDAAFPVEGNKAVNF